MAVLVVTGASRGIGAATAIGAARRGWSVAVNFVRDQAAAGAIVETIRSEGGSARALQGDVGNSGDVARLFREAESMGPIGGLVNNAGVVEARMRVDGMSPERIERIFRINVIGSMLCAGEAVRRMSTRRGGRGGVIVNLSSAAARLGSPDQYVDYAASKGAIDTFTIGLAREVAEEGIRVNGVRPGIIDTEIHADAGAGSDEILQMRAVIPHRRIGSAQEVANAILWLLSDAASYVTGATLDVTGGR